jgi:CRISPR-associated exonuclease Cas4
MILVEPWAGLLVAGAIVLLLWGALELRELSAGRRHGRLQSVDARGAGERLVSERYRLVGRPDEIRRRPDGRPVPVEWKSRAAPMGRPPRSHVLQVAAYCLLLEQVTGFAPPYGILRYRDGVEVEVPWDAEAREEVLRVRRAIARPYDGRALPAPAKCAGCRWRPGCDAAS